MRGGVVCAVPARLQSSRFPRKLLHPLLGKPVIVHTLERAAEAGCFAEVVCLTDSGEIGAAVEEAGFRFVLTGEAANGTERIGRNLDSLRAGLVVNLQGDEPAFPVEGLRRLCAALEQHPEWVHTLVHEESPTALDLENPNRVKGVLDSRNFVLDFCRALPSHLPLRGPGGIGIAATDSIRLHLGAYAYSAEYLRRYAVLPRSPRELELSHEMLRAPGLRPLRAHPSAPGAPVDVPADLETARERLAAMPAGVPAW